MSTEFTGYALEEKSLGLLEGMLSVIGDEDTAIGGMYSTRLTVVANPGDTVLQVETTMNWAPSGKLALGGVTYFYTGITATSFTGITHQDNDVSVVGVHKQHLPPSELLDLNRSRNALDAVRRAMLLDYATGDDLAVIGRNLGVMRLTFVATDDNYRDIIKALAYNPRGTMFGLELALTALVGAGNFRILEDLVNFPCTVFIEVTGSAMTSTESMGKAFFASQVNKIAAPSADDTVVINTTPQAVQSVRLADTDIVTDCRTAKPSAQHISEGVFPSHPWAAWVWNGGVLGLESRDVLVDPGGYCTFNYLGPSHLVSYYRFQRIQPQSRAEWGMVFGFDPGSVFHSGATGCKQWSFCVSDTEKAIAWGCQWDGSHLLLGFMDWTTKQLISGPGIWNPALQVDGSFQDVRVVKNGTNSVQLWLNGRLVQSMPYSSFVASSSYQTSFGCLLDSTLSPGGLTAWVKSVYHHVETQTDYWAARGTGASMEGVSPNLLSVETGIFQADRDEGKFITISGSTVTNPSGGNNNGRFLIGSVIDAQTVGVFNSLVTPPGTSARVGAGGPSRIIIDGADKFPFAFPDMLGQYIYISGSAHGNDGIYRITRILESDTGLDMAGWLTPGLRDTSNVCEVVSYPGGDPVTFVAEGGLGWCQEPDFIAETGLAWEVGDMGTFAGDTLTLPQALPLPYVSHFTRVLEVKFSQVRSGQLLRNAHVVNEMLLPPAYRYYPFYLADPLGFVRSYLDAIVAAGIIPEYETT